MNISANITRYLKNCILQEKKRRKKSKKREGWAEFDEERAVKVAVTAESEDSSTDRKSVVVVNESDVCTNSKLWNYQVQKLKL